MKYWKIILGFNPYKVLIISLMVLIVVALQRPPEVYSDPAWQLLAIDQYNKGISPTVNHVALVDSKDISKDSFGWITWWPPGTQLFAGPLILSGMSIAESIRVVSVACIILGAIGWISWFKYFSLPGWAILIVALFLPWIRYVHNPLYIYSAEALAFAVSPWLLILTHKVSKSPKIMSSIALGLMLGMAYWLKYSLILLVTGTLAYFWFESLTRLINSEKIKPLSKIEYKHALFTTISAAFPILVITLLNSFYSGAGSSALASIQFDPRISELLALAGNPALALTGAGDLFNYIFMHPVHGLLKMEFTVIGFGIPGTAIIIYFILNMSDTSPGRLGLIVFISGCLLMLIIWTVSNKAADYDHRHFVIIVFAVAPIIFNSAIDHWKGYRRTGKTIVGLFALVYICLPMLYGVVAAIQKSTRVSDNYQAGDSGLYNPLISSTSVTRALKGLPKLDKNSVLYVYSPVVALDAPGRKIVTHADFEFLEVLQKTKYYSSSSTNVLVLIPSAFEENRKGFAIRNSFGADLSWTRTKLVSSELLLWAAKINRE